MSEACFLNIESELGGTGTAVRPLRTPASHITADGDISAALAGLAAPTLRRVVHLAKAQGVWGRSCHYSGERS